MYNRFGRELCQEQNSGGTTKKTVHRRPLPGSTIGVKRIVKCNKFMAHRAFDNVLRYIRKLAPSPADAVLGDGALLDRFVAKRDESAFETLLQRHGPMVLGVCRRMLRDPQQVEDAFQVTFIVFLRKARSLHRRELLGNWLYGVAYRTALKARGAAARRAQREQPLGEVRDPSNEGELTERDVKLALDEAVNHLPAKYRQPIVYCYLEGNSVNEAAARLGCPAGTVAGRLARAKEMLRTRLIKRGITVSAPLLVALSSQDASACVPAALITKMLRAVTILAHGDSGIASGLSPSVSMLAKEVLKAMFLNKLKIAAIVVATFGALGSGILVYSEVAGQQRQPDQTGPAAQSLHGDQEEAFRREIVELRKEFQTLQTEKAKELVQASKSSDKMAALLLACYQAACDEFKIRVERLLEGRDPTHTIFGSSLRVLEAERELSTKKGDQIVAFENHWHRMKGVEKLVQLKSEAGSGATQDVAETRFYRLQAEVWMERAKAP